MTAGRAQGSRPSNGGAGGRGSIAGAGRLAVVLTGGGARAAYQVGLLRCLAKHRPEVAMPIITGISAGAINSTYLAARGSSLVECVDELTQLWSGLSTERVFRVGTWPLLRNFLRWGLRLLSGGATAVPQARSLVDTQPLRELLRHELAPHGGEIGGLASNIASGRLEAFALSTVKYATGQTVTWVQGRDIRAWERPNRLGVRTRIGVEHVMASAALPVLFPAVELDGDWYGDGGLRMLTPLAPAIHLGADRILAISNRYPRSATEAANPATIGYPPLVQVAGSVLNAIFLDTVDQDAERLRRVNRLLARIPPAEQRRLRPIKLLVLQPSVDLGRLAADYEPRLPRTFRFLTRGLGTRETKSPDFLSLLMFQPDYLSKLIEIGERDAEARLGEIAELLG